MSAPQPLIAFVELRMRLLKAELEAATLVGRSDDVGKIKAEMAFLPIEPRCALMIRVSQGRLLAGGAMRGQNGFQSQMNMVQRRLTELKTEVAQWCATHSPGCKG